MALSPATGQHERVLGQLEQLVRETYLLWDRDWVGFSWRAYTFDHVQRVRGLARTLAAAEGGDVTVTDFAALLHDITKSYDGEIVVRDGKRVLDANGFWQNETLLPDRENEVTRIYARLGLGGTLHSISGALVAEELLREAGLTPEFIASVTHAIRQHLKPDSTASLEARALYDADTIDSNIGLPAFYRNIQISLHMLDKRLADTGSSVDAMLAAGLQDYLSSYLRERVPTWIHGKHRDFVEKLTTDAGKRLGGDRIDRLTAAMAASAEEMDDFARHLRSGRLGVIHRFMTNRTDPTLAAELAVLSDGWQHQPDLTPGARQFVELIRKESAGEL